MGPYFYRHSGCLVQSELEMPEWHGFAVEGCASAEADIIIRIDSAIEPTDSPDHEPVVDGNSLRFSVPDVGTWRISNGSQIAINPVAGRDCIEVRLFTLGSAWGALGYQRGWPMLHGSAVLGPTGAVLFCGPQEAGKSTMAAAMSERGAPLVGDDLSRAEPGRVDRPARLYPSSTRHKLWREAIDQLGFGQRERVQDYFRAEKYHLESAFHVPTDLPVPLVGIYALSFGDRLEIEPLSGAEAAKTVLSETIYRPYFLEAMGLLTEQAVHAARIAASVPVFRLKRPRDLTQVDAVCARLREHLLETA